MDRKEEFYELSSNRRYSHRFLDRCRGRHRHAFRVCEEGRRELPEHIRSRWSARDTVLGRQLRGATRVRAAAGRRVADQRVQLPGVGHAREARTGRARRCALDRETGDADRVPHRADVPPHHRVRVLPEGALQLVCGSTGDVFEDSPRRGHHRLHRSAVTPAAAAASERSSTTRPASRPRPTRSTAASSGPMPLRGHRNSISSSRRSRAR